MSTIAVIIPCYKDSKTLERAILSINQQTFKVTEIIVVNDCSPETEIIDNIILKFPDIIYIKNNKNIGLAGSRNVGINISKSEIICLLDADDELHPQKIEIQYKLLKPNNAVSCYTENIINKKNDIKYFKGFNYKVIKSVNQNILRNNIVGASIMIYRKLIIDVGLYDVSLKSCEDFDLWIRLLKRNINIYIVKLPLYLYYFNQNGLSKNFIDISYWEIQVLKKHLNFNKKIDSNFSEFVVFIWVIRQFYRYRKEPNNSLKIMILSNINMFHNYSIFKLLLNIYAFLFL